MKGGIMRIKRTVLAMLLLALCVFICACSGSDSDKKASDKKSDKSSSSSSDKKDSEEGKSTVLDLLGGDKKDADSDLKTGDKQDTSKSDRHIDHKYFELVTVNGYTREQILADENLAADLAMWDFLEYGTGVEVSFDYDNGYIQYTWYAVSPNAYSSAPIDNPSATDYMQDYTDFLNMGEQPEWIPISVRYSDDTITLTFTEGGGTHVYKLRE